MSEDSMNVTLQTILDERQARTKASLDVPIENETGSWPFGEFIQYCCVVAVSDALHFTRAAQRLHMDQSAVSRHVQKLEAVLGVKLFNRGNRGVELTEAGAAFAQRARKALRTAREAATTAQAIGGGEPRELELVYSTLVNIHAVAEIKRIAEKASNAKIHFRSVMPDELTECLWDGTAHAGITLLPVGADLSSQRLFREELLVAAPDSLQLGISRMISIRRLNALPLIWPFGAVQAPFSKQILGLLRERGCNSEVAVQAHSISEALAAVREGFGITFIKSSDLHLRPTGMTFCRVAGSQIHLETGITYVAGPRWNSLKRLLALITDRLASSLSEA